MKDQLDVATPAEYLAAVDAKRRLLKASIGKSCVRFKKLEDLEEKSLAALIEVTARMGLGT